MSNIIITPEINSLIRTALHEDMYPNGDITTESLKLPNYKATARVVINQPGVIAGIDIAKAVIKAVYPNSIFQQEVSDGLKLKPGDIVLTVSAPVASILAAERTMLNFLTFLSGIATTTNKWVQEVASYAAKIRDTRKTIPGFRYLQKYAVRVGGGTNHRMNLGDAILIKDNHLLVQSDLVQAYQSAKTASPNYFCEIEVDTLEQLKTILPAEPELVLLDNFSIKATRKAVKLKEQISPASLLESSGGIRFEEVKEVAATGVDFIAVGALTHTITNLDMSLEIDSIDKFVDHHKNSNDKGK